MNDPAVPRRARMLQAGGAELVVIGFRRGTEAPASIAGAPAVDLGRTADARLIQRAFAVLGNLVWPGRMLAAAAGADIIIGRNLEALALARRIRSANPAARLVYECLDIHRTLLGSGAGAKAVQAIEARLLGAIDLLIVSSPAFVRDYFAHRPTLTAPTLLAENKLLALDGPPPTPSAPPSGPPWVIGWLGNLRCRRTFAVLRDLAARQAGRVEILIAGRPSPAEFPDFDGQVAAAPHVRFIGSYSSADLPRIYARCHFAWAIDYFEEGLNSRWLLPNRLYEAPSFGTVPIALASVETGRWLAGHGAGLLVDDASDLDAVLTNLDTPDYAAMRARVAAIPRGALVADQADCAALMTALAGR
jgi:glycosyltransferase involved in cell wall biosynthesis